MQRVLAAVLAIIMNVFALFPTVETIKNIPEKTDESLRVISFNVRCASDLYGSVAVRSRRFVKAMKDYDPDVMGLQEVTERWLKIIKKNLSDKYEIVYAFRDDADGTECSPVLFKKDKFELLDSGTFWLSETPDVPGSMTDGADLPRVCSFAKLKDKTTGKTFTALNTHLHHFGTDIRLKQIEYIKAYLKDVFEGDDPFFFTGDFNSSEGASEYNSLCTVMTDSKFIAKNSDDGITYHDYEKISPDDTYWKIDFIFVSKNITVDTYKIIDEKLEKGYISDHYGLCADINI